MKTIAEMQSILSSMGIKKRFKPYCEGERDTVLLHVRKPAKIVDGFLIGSEIDLYDSNTFRVWTNRKQKANATAKQHNLKVRLMDGEAELYVPASLVDELLPRFGAIVKRNVKPPNEAQRAALIAHSFKYSRDKTKVPASETGKPYKGSGVGVQIPEPPICKHQSQEINETSKI